MIEACPSVHGVKALELLAECRHRLNRDTDIPESVTLDGLYRLAERCRQQGYDDLWRDVTDLALQLPHATHQQVFHRGEAKLIHGDWSGWVDREARLFDPAHHAWQTEYWRAIRWAEQPWDGKEDIGDKTIFLIADGSDSDCVQMMCYVPVVASAADRVVLGVSPSLFTLARHNFGSLATVTFREVEHAIPFQRYAWMASLPAILGEPPEFERLRAPRPAPRRAVDPERLQVGLCWVGPLDVMRPLFVRTDVQWHSLHVDERPGDDAEYGALIRPSPRFYTLADAANYIMGLDCVVSVCAPAAHLAGALGVPTVLVLPSGADARWGRGDTTPWYPSMRLIRQRTPGDWTSVIDGVVAAVNSHNRQSSWQRTTS